MNTEKLKSVKEKYEALGAQIIQPEVIADNKEWTRLVKEHSSLEPIVSAYDRLVKTQSDIDGALEMLKNEREPEMLELAKEELEEKKAELEKVTEELKILLLPTDPNDEKNVIVEIRGGAGGEEANLFAAELVRMYKMWAAAHRMKVEDIDVNETELGGIKEAVFQISGESVYRVLKYESGAHRVQRVPETESQGRVHTSTATVAVLPEAEDVEVEIKEEDIRVDVYRSSGAGGQKVNKTETAIRITHFPTGIVVTCQDERSQLKNKDKAFKVLRSRLYDHYATQNRSAYDEHRKSLVGTGDRSERIRTYNFPQGRVTDHRIGLSVYNLNEFIMGDIEDMIEALTIAEREARLAGEE